MKMPPILKAGILICGALTLASCSNSHAPLETVKNLDPQRYQGQWHEVARLPNFFEHNVVAARATYGEIPGSKSLSVLNEGVKVDGKRTRISGAASLVGQSPVDEAELKVRFNRFSASLFAGDYWILDLNEQHTRAVVGTPNRKYLWLLSKDPSDQVEDFTVPLKKMKHKGFAVENLIVNPKRIK